MSRLRDIFTQRLKEYNDKPIVIDGWYHYITFDVMVDLAFSTSYHQLETGSLHRGVTGVRRIRSLLARSTALASISQS
jgi:hypothetical protein